METLIAIRGGMDKEFAKVANKQGKYAKPELIVEAIEGL